MNRANWPKIIVQAKTRQNKHQTHCTHGGASIMFSGLFVCKIICQSGGNY